MLEQKKILNLMVVTASLLGYLQWGKGDHMFLFQAETEILMKLFTNPGSVIHPFILLPLAGQLMLLFTLFQQQPSKELTLLAIAALGSLLLLIFFIGIISVNWKIIFSIIPFLIVGIQTIRIHLKKTT